MSLIRRTACVIVLASGVLAFVPSVAEASSPCTLVGLNRTGIAVDASCLTNGLGPGGVSQSPTSTATTVSTTVPVPEPPPVEMHDAGRWPVQVEPDDSALPAGPIAARTDASGTEAPATAAVAGISITIPPAIATASESVAAPAPAQALGATGFEPAAASSGGLRTDIGVAAIPGNAKLAPANVAVAVLPVESTADDTPLAVGAGLSWPALAGVAIALMLAGGLLLRRRRPA